MGQATKITFVGIIQYSRYLRLSIFILKNRMLNYSDQLFNENFIQFTKTTVFTNQKRKLFTTAQSKQEKPVVDFGEKTTGDMMLPIFTCSMGSEYIHSSE